MNIKDLPNFSKCIQSYLLTYLLTYGAVNCAAPQELPSFLWNPKVQYRVHKSPPLVPIPSHINPIHYIPSYLSKIILILSTPYHLQYVYKRLYKIKTCT
jgi:hypothetical protein